MPSIVAITDTMTIQLRDFFGRTQAYQTQSSGSGIIVGKNDTELLIATNNHVVAVLPILQLHFQTTKTFLPLLRVQIQPRIWRSSL